MASGVAAKVTIQLSGMGYDSIAAVENPLPPPAKAECARAAQLDRDLPSDLDDLIGGQAEEIADMDRVALHHGEERLLPCGKALAVLAADHRFMADVIGDVIEIDRAPQRFAGREQLRNMRALHET